MQFVVVVSGGELAARVCNCLQESRECSSRIIVQERTIIRGGYDRAESRAQTISIIMIVVVVGRFSFQFSVFSFQFSSRFQLQVFSLPAREKPNG